MVGNLQAGSAVFAVRTRLSRADAMLTRAALPVDEVAAFDDAMALADEFTSFTRVETADNTSVVWQTRVMAKEATETHPAQYQNRTNTLSTRVNKILGEDGVETTTACRPC